MEAGATMVNDVSGGTMDPRMHRQVWGLGWTVQLPWDGLSSCRCAVDGLGVCPPYGQNLWPRRVCLW